MTANIASRFEVLVKMRLKHLTQLKLNQLDSVKDKNGGASSSLSGTLRFIAVSDYILDKNINAFRSNLTDAASLYVKILDRSDNGEMISHSYISMTIYKEPEFGIRKGNRERLKNDVRFWLLRQNQNHQEPLHGQYYRTFLPN